jgi:predicted ATP-grasp superfamily ATP-dependent carboligase
MVPGNFAHGQLAVVRTLGRMGVPVHAVHDSRRAPTARSRYGRTLVMSNDDPAAPATLEELLAIGSRLGRPVLIPTDDVAALFVAEHHQPVSEAFLVPAQPPGLAARLANKATLESLCTEFGVPVPRSTAVASMGDAEEVVTRVSFPVMVKAPDPLLLRGAGRPSVTVARSAAELLAIVEPAVAEREPNILVQEFIPGGPDAAWVLGACFTSDGECPVVGSGRKLRDEPPGHGVTSYAIADQNEELLAVALPFFRALGYRGALDTCWRLDRRDGQFKLLDANPRVGANFRLWSAGGVDVVRALYLDLTGQAVPSGPSSTGRRFVVEPFDYWSVAAQDPRPLPWRRWAREVVAADERAWWCLDDPWPALMLLVVLVARAARARLGAWGRRTRRVEP